MSKYNLNDLPVEPQHYLKDQDMLTTYKQPFGIMSIVLPKRKERVFHRLNVEYLLALRKPDRQRICALLRAGLMRNIEQSEGDIRLLNDLEVEICTWADEIIEQRKMIAEGLSNLRELLHRSHSVKVLEASLTARQASRKMATALFQPGSFSKQSLEHTRAMLKNALQINVKDYRALFELGWLNLFVLGRVHEAEFYFEKASHYSEEVAPHFSGFVLRHLADTYYSQNKCAAALEAIEKANALVDYGEPEMRYEYARYLAVNGYGNQAAGVVRELVEYNALYYLQVQSEPDFQQQVEIDNILEVLRQERIEQIEKIIELEWVRNPVRRFDLPNGCNPSRVHLRAVNTHMETLYQANFFSAARMEKTVRKDVETTTYDNLRENLVRYRRNCRLDILRLRKRYHWLNRLGGSLLHLSAITAIAVVLFNLSQLLNWSLGNGRFLLDGLLMMQVFAVTLVVASASVALMFYDSGKVHKLRKKLMKFNKAFDFLKDVRQAENNQA